MPRLTVISYGRSGLKNLLTLMGGGGGNLCSWDVITGMKVHLEIAKVVWNPFCWANVLTNTNTRRKHPCTTYGGEEGEEKLKPGAETRKQDLLEVVELSKSKIMLPFYSHSLFSVFHRHACGKMVEYM